MKTLPDIVDRSMLASAYIAACDVYGKSGAGGKAFKCRWTSAYAELVRYPDYDMLVFKGSAEFIDWLVNASAIPVPYLRGWAHAGFMLAHWSIWRAIKPCIRFDRPLVLVGHSLGGVMADYSASALRGHTRLHLIAFGKPNGWLKAKPIHRPWLKTNLSVVSGSDIVTRLPRYLFGPDPGQNMLYLPNDPAAGIYLVNPERPVRLRDFRLREFADDHSMRANYSAGVSNVLRNWPEAA